MQALRSSACNTFLRPKPILPDCRIRALQAGLPLLYGVLITSRERVWSARRGQGAARVLRHPQDGEVTRRAEGPPYL